MNILGVNAFHGDSSAALVKDGRLVAAVEEERFNRVKHWAGFPEESIRYCLNEGGLNVDDLDHIAVSFNPRANFLKKLSFLVRYRPSLKAVMDRAKRQGKALILRSLFSEIFDVDESMMGSKIHFVEHHDAHIASGFLVSPYDDSAILSIDGMGDFVSTCFAEGFRNEYKILSKIYFPHSLGLLYQAITLYLGFPDYGDEYKVMGLAPFGRPKYKEIFDDIVLIDNNGFHLNLKYFNHHQNGIDMEWNGGRPCVKPFHASLLEERLGEPRKRNDELSDLHQDIAASLQAKTEEVVIHLCYLLSSKVSSRNLTMVGGVAMNCVANGKVLLETDFENLYVPVGAADNGTAIGAAFYIWNRILNEDRVFALETPFLGTQCVGAEIPSIARAYDLQPRGLDDHQLFGRVVEDLCSGKVVGWFSGKMEFGARALGHRSLLADPRRKDMRELINSKIKYREKFRPFAPSILEEYVEEYFENGVATPFMEKVFKIRKEKQDLIPAVTHVDGTGRLQTVSKRWNERYWLLIDAFREKTGIPVLLNTSLNENEPIVNLPSEAIECFLRTDMDILVIENYYFTKEKL